MHKTTFILCSFTIHTVSCQHSEPVGILTWENIENKADRQEPQLAYREKLEATFVLIFVFFYAPRVIPRTDLLQNIATLKSNLMHFPNRPSRFFKGAMNDEEEYMLLFGG